VRRSKVQNALERFITDAFALGAYTAVVWAVRFHRDHYPAAIGMELRAAAAFAALGDRKYAGDAVRRALRTGDGVRLSRDDRKTFASLNVRMTNLDAGQLLERLTAEFGGRKRVPFAL
jgi:hypothetical protein